MGREFYCKKYKCSPRIFCNVINHCTALWITSKNSYISPYGVPISCLLAIHIVYLYIDQGLDATSLTINQCTCGNPLYWSEFLLCTCVCYLHWWLRGKFNSIKNIKTYIQNFWILLRMSRIRLVWEAHAMCVMCNSVYIGWCVCVVDTLY